MVIEPQPNIYYYEESQRGQQFLGFSRENKSDHFYISLAKKHSDNTGHFLDNPKERRLATPSEINWIKACIELDKYIEYNEKFEHILEIPEILNKLFKNDTNTNTTTEM